jgi:hypothetical protein
LLDGRQCESSTLPVVLLALLLHGDSKVVEGTTHAEPQERVQQWPQGTPDSSWFPFDTTPKERPTVHRFKVTDVAVRRLADEPLNHQMPWPVVLHESPSSSAEARVSAFECRSRAYWRSRCHPHVVDVSVIPLWFVAQVSEEIERGFW